jgi:hypothetical protein
MAAGASLRLPRVAQRRDVRQEATPVEVHGVPAEGLHHGCAYGGQRLAQIRRGPDPVPQVVVVHSLA